MRMRIAVLCLFIVMSLLAALPASSSEGGSQTIITQGPLNRIEVGADLSCAVERGGLYSFYGVDACGTFLAVDTMVYGPAEIPAGPGEGDEGYAAWTPASQSNVRGGGTAADPLEIVTVVDGGGLRITQTDTYVVGADSIRTVLEVRNNGASRPIILYRAGDCFFGGDDAGFGHVDVPRRSPACVEGLYDEEEEAVVRGDGEIRWVPHQTDGANYYAGLWPDVWGYVGNGEPFPDLCEMCDQYVDNASGISWATTIPNGQTRTFSHDLVITKSSIEPAGQAFLSSGSVMVDPRTGQLVIAFPPFDRSDVTINAQPRCPGDTTPTSAILRHGPTREYPMSGPQADGRTFSATIPAADVTHDTPVTVEAACPGGPVTLVIGTITLYDPSGFVTDVFSGAPIPSATVTLYRVPGWRPRAAGEADTTPSTCQSGQSKSSPDDPWTQPAPTDLGVVLDPTDPATPVSPSVQPFITDHRGYYGWDVPEGCFYVVVAKDGYQTLTSPVVGVPPEVLDLDLQMTPLPPNTGPAPEVIRLSGPNRTVTAAEISKATFQPNVAVAYVATQDNFPDALAGGPAAAIQGGPILLVGRDSIPDATRTELERLRPRRIVVLGGTGVVSDTVLGQLGPLSVPANQVSRLSGPNRFATAAAISQATFPAGVRVAYIATGDRFPDALAGGGAAARNHGPVLLVQQGAVPDATRTELQRLGPARIVVLGGASAVSDAVMEALRPLTEGTVTRLSGLDRFATAGAIAATFPAPSPTVYIATGGNFPDALAGVPAAGQQRGAVLLVPGTTIPDSVVAQLQRLQPRRIFVLGGEAVVSRQVAEQLSNYLRP